MKKTFNKEEDVKAAVKEILKATPNCYWFMPPANGFGRAGVSDLVGCVAGRFFAVETKFGYGKPTANQTREIAKVKAAGAPAWIVNEKNLEAWAAEFKEWAACS